jgi:hypothetical protein
MAFADPQSITVNAVAQSLPRVSVGQDRSSYSKDDGTYKLTLSHQYGKRIRRTARVDGQKTSADPLTPANSVLSSMSVYIVADVPKTGYSIVEQKQICDALVAYLSASSGANVTKLLGGEN